MSNFDGNEIIGGNFCIRSSVKSTFLPKCAKSRVFHAVLVLFLPNSVKSRVFYAVLVLFYQIVPKVV